MPKSFSHQALRGPPATSPLRPGLLMYACAKADPRAPRLSRGFPCWLWASASIFLRAEAIALAPYSWAPIRSALNSARLRARAQMRVSSES
eukprot:2780303-Prymnesium_polylepis.2